LIHSAVVAFREDESASRLFLFRSYNHPPHKDGQAQQAGVRIPAPLNPGLASSYKIEEVAAATSAAPSYFNPVTLGIAEDRARYVDGAIKGNNPASIAWQEAWHMARHHNPSVSASQAIAGLVSIGTGKSVWNILGDQRSLPLMKYTHMFRMQSKIITDTVCGIYCP
jgi:hypothetical protein